MAKGILDAAALGELFVALRPETTAEEKPEIGALLGGAIASAQERWSDVDAPVDGFVRHLAARLPRGSIVQAMVTLRAEDLYLAFACSLRDPAALAAFEATFASEFKLVLSRSRGAIDPEDFRQTCREKLFAADRPKVADYSGQGDLRSWVRVTLLRALIDLSRKRRELGLMSDDRALSLPSPGDDPELDYLKRLYRDEFKQAFEEAALALTAEDRNLLRYHHAHGLSIDEIGNLYNVHRATAARRIARARDELFAGTRRRLMARLKLNRDELDSVMRMIESNVHVSLGRVLGAEHDEAG